MPMPNASQLDVRRGRTSYLPTLAETFVAFCMAIAMAVPTIPSWAISPDRSLSQLDHESWTARDGAPAGTDMIAQTSDGFLWFATRNGLFRFDGVQFERYVSTPEDAVPAAAVRSLLALPGNRLLIGWSFGGATLLRDGQATRYGERDGYPPGTTYGFQVDGAGNLWAATSSALARFNGIRWERVGAEWNFDGQRALALFVDRDGTLGAFTDKTLMTLPKGATSFRSTGGKLTTRSQIVQSVDGTYFFSDVRGIRSVANLNGYDRMDRPWIVETTARSDTTPLLVDRDGGLWFGTETEHGVGRIARPGRRQVAVEYFSKQDGLSDLYVATVFEDRDGSIWVSTRSGVDRFRSSRFLSPSELARASFPALLPQADGALRFGALARGGLRELSADGVTRRVAPLFITCAYRDAAGTAWYGSQPTAPQTAQLFREEAGRLQKIGLPSDVPPGFDIQAIVVDAQHAPWISVVRHGVYRRAGGTWSKPAELPEGGGLPAIVMTTDKQGGVWLGYVNDVVVRWQDGAARTYSKEDGIELGNALSIFATDKHVWVGGQSGLVLLEGDRFRTMVVGHDEVLRGITGIVETKEGHLWLHGTAGAVFIQAPEVLKAIEDRGHAMAYRLFDDDDGLRGTPTEIRPLPTLVAGHDGRLWFGTGRGVFMLDPDRIVINKVPPNVVIKAVVAGDDVYRSPADLTLPPLTTNLRIDYTATSLVAPRRVRFRYKLEGVDADWKNARDRRQAFYTNLGPGRYNFHVTAMNEDGVWNQDGASLSFAIAPAWYQTRWFIALCALLAAAALALVYRIRIGQVRAQTHARLQVRLLERERIARELHDTLIQGFQGLILTLEAAMRRIPAELPLRRQIEEALARADVVLAEGRDRVRGLRESAVFQGDLPTAVTEVAQDLSRLHPSASNVSVSGTQRALHPVAMEEAYLIAREAITNAFRHASAQRVEIEINFGDNRLRIRISDNGKGVDADVLASGGSPGHWGLSGMRERAHKLGAKLLVRSGPGSGTDVELDIPAAVAYRHPHADSSWWRRLRAHLRKDANDAE
jgi:signal transduction histidine kinase/ligand-binding sensor domain-containing protein